MGFSFKIIFYDFGTSFDFIHFVICLFQGLPIIFFDCVLGNQVYFILHFENFFAGSYLNHFVIVTELEIFDGSFFCDFYF